MQVVIQISGLNEVAVHCLTFVVSVALLVGSWRLLRAFADLVALGFAFVSKRWGW